MSGTIPAPARQPSPLVTGAVVFAWVFLLTVLMGSAPAVVQAQGLNNTASLGTPTTTLTAPKAAKPASAALAHPAAVTRASKPAWTDLSPIQQQALQPLAAGWNSISEAQKRKWLALSKNYPALPPEEQAKLRSRMTEWVALSPAQRVQARLNFAEANKISPGDKKAKWQAYQALPPEEKKKLAAGAQTKPPSTAAAVKPITPQKMTKVPQSPQKTPLISTAPNEVDHNTLLPQIAPGATIPVHNN